jgi:hypothetical protein
MHYTAIRGSIKEPTLYLGANVGKMQFEDGHEVWYMSLRSYVKGALDVVQHLLDDDREGNSLKSKVKNPFKSGNHPELDVMDELGPELTSRFMQLIGILCWCIELG